MRSALRSTHSTVGWWSVAGRSVRYFVFFLIFFVFFALKWASLPTRVCSQVGETVFHVCFLMGTPIHMHLAKVEHNKENFIKMFHLAKRMLKHFPLLLNDIYLSEEYYGENVLHMAAVAEVIMANYRIEKCCNRQDPSIVKWLLDIGADFHRRCYGTYLVSINLPFTDYCLSYFPNL